eukprot:6212004-Pleurochrysis_carterae.AAC.1
MLTSAVPTSPSLNPPPKPSPPSPPPPPTPTPPAPARSPPPPPPPTPPLSAPRIAASRPNASASTSPSKVTNASPTRCSSRDRHGLPETASRAESTAALLKWKGERSESARPQCAE